MRWFFGDVLKSFTKIFAQSEMDAKRLEDAGADRVNVEVTGSFKFDVAKRDEKKELEISEWLFPDGRKHPILLGGSTWPQEDEVLLRIYKDVIATNPDVRLVIVPRHFEKADVVERNIAESGFTCIRRSKGQTLKDVSSDSTPVFLGDTSGEMMAFTEFHQLLLLVRAFVSMALKI
jgi:3-deoxy-D-manno-octulosonic-acid transferase